MVAVAFAPTQLSCKPVAARKAVAGVPVLARTPKVQARVNRAVMASSTQQEKLAAAVTVSMGAMMVHPLMAEAATVTPSLKNLLLSVVSGGLVLGIIALGITAISNFDPISRQ